MKQILTIWVILLFNLSLLAQDKLLHMGVIEMPPYTSAQYLQDYGLFTEIVNAACSESGITPLYDLIPAKRAAMTVKAGRLFGAFPFTKSHDEADEFYFSDPVLFLKGTFFYHKKHFKGNRQAKNLESITHLQLGGVLGSFYQEELRQKGLTLHNVSSEKLLLGMMEKQRIDLAPMDFTSGWNFIREYYPGHVMDFDTLPFTFTTESLHVMVSKKYPQAQELLKNFNDGLHTIQQNGKLNAIFAKYNVSRTQQQQTGTNKKICLALDGELGDRGFNDMQYNGLLEAKNRFNIDIAFRIPPQNRGKDTLLTLIDNLIAQERCDMVISAGFPMLHPVLEASGKYPNIIFAHVDSGSLKEIPKNLVTANFAQAEGSFAVGFLASRLSVRKKVGYIGGVNIPVLKTFEKGFRAGVKYGAPEMEVVTQYISELPDYSGFSNPEKAEKLAEEMYEKDTDIIYAVAGESGLGVIKAAKEERLYVIGVDSDQDYLAKGYVLTSMMKRVDIAVLDIIKRLEENRLEGGKNLRYGFKNGGISLSEMKYTKDKIGKEIIQELRKVQSELARGIIKIKD